MGEKEGETSGEKEGDASGEKEGEKEGDGEARGTVMLRRMFWLSVRMTNWPEGLTAICCGDDNRAMVDGPSA